MRARPRLAGSRRGVRRLVLRKLPKNEIFQVNVVRGKGVPRQDDPPPSFRPRLRGPPLQLLNQRARRYHAHPHFLLRLVLLQLGDDDDLNRAGHERHRAADTDCCDAHELYEANSRRTSRATTLDGPA